MTMPCETRFASAFPTTKASPDGGGTQAESDAFRPAAHIGNRSGQAGGCLIIAYVAAPPNFLEEPISLLLTDTNVANVLSMSAGHPDMTVIAGIIVANADGSARLVSVCWTLDSTDYLIFRRSVAANETVTKRFPIPSNSTPRVRRGSSRHRLRRATWSP
jgi:hypothetical protein